MVLGECCNEGLNYKYSCGFRFFLPELPDKDDYEIKRASSLIIIEQGLIRSYALDNRLKWEIGRRAEGVRPDIELGNATISRRHGRFENIGGFWYYFDYAGKNGTYYRHAHIEKGLNGRVKPRLLSEGDTFVLEF